MRIASLLSSHGGSILQLGLERGLKKLGHVVEPYHHNISCDLILVFNQSAHTTEYAYPEFPSESDRTPIAFIDAAEYGWTKRVHEPPERYWNTFASGSMEHPTKNLSEQERLRRFLEGRSFPYFLREFMTSWSFPPSYHPIDYPLHEGALPGKRPNRKEYLSRHMQVACLWGLSNPWRVNLTAELEASPFRKDIYVIERDGPRLNQWGGNGYFARIEAARCSISFDGYGSGSFRVTEVLCRTLLIQGLMSIRTREPVIHGDTCVAYALRTDGPNYLGSDLIEKIGTALSDPEWCYRVYERGYHHCMTHLTEKATAEYVLRVVDGHDWNQPTVI